MIAPSELQFSTTKQIKPPVGHQSASFGKKMCKTHVNKKLSMINNGPSLNAGCQPLHVIHIYVYIYIFQTLTVWDLIGNKGTKDRK